MLIWVFECYALLLFFFKSCLAVMAKNNPTEKQIDVEIQATLKHGPAWKLTEECKVYRYKIVKIDLNCNLQLLASKYQKQSPGSVPWKRCSWKFRKIYKKTPMSESRFHLDYLLLLQRFPLLTLNMNNKCCRSIPWNTLSRKQILIQS